jgi:histidinol-phosphate aminotransferase
MTAYFRETNKNDIRYFPVIKRIIISRGSGTRLLVRKNEKKIKLPTKFDMIFSQRIRRLTPYTPGEQPQDRKYLKLNTNENPYPPSPRIADLLKSFDFERLRLYPDPLCTRLREKLGENYGVHPNQVFVSNGSDEALSFCFYAFFDSSQGKLLFPAVTYSFYPVYCDFYGIEYEKVPMDPALAIDCDELIKRKDSCGIIFSNPNAPTGTLLSLGDIARLLHNYPRKNVVVIDEAYIDFGGDSALPLLKDFSNLLLVRTFSKSMSLAGLRLGFAIGHQDLIHTLFRAKDAFNSYPIDTLAQLIGEVALSDDDYYRSIKQKIISTRDRFSQELGGIGWRVLPSKANFLFITRRGIPGKDVYLRLKEKGILVRHFDGPLTRDFVRVTIGKAEDMDRLFDTLKELF